MLHDLGIAGDHGNARLLSGIGHRAHFRFEHRGRQTRLQDEAGNNCFRLRS